MKITKSQLKQIIKEELSKVLNEQSSIPFVSRQAGAGMMKKPAGSFSSPDVAVGLGAKPTRDLETGEPMEKEPEVEVKDLNELESWLGLTRKEVDQILADSGLNPRKKWYLDLPTMDPRRVKFREWYRCEVGKGPCQSASEYARKQVEMLKGVLKDIPMGSGKIDAALKQMHSADPVPKAPMLAPSPLRKPR